MVFFLILLSMAQFFAPHASAATMQNQMIPNHFKRGYLSSGLESTYLSTQNNYDSSGASSPLVGSSSLTLIKTLIYGRYDWSNKTSLYAEAPIVYAKSDDPLASRTKTSFNGVGIGMNYNLGFKSFQAILDFRIYGSIEKWAPGSDDVQTSDGAHKLDSGIHLMKDFSSLMLHGFLGYQYRTQGFSNLLKYQIDGTYFAKSFSLSSGFNGYQSVSDDQYKDNPSQRINYLKMVNAGSFAEGSINPSLLNFFVQGKLPASQAIDLYGSFAQAIAGKNISQQFTFTLGFEYFFEPVKFKKEIIPVYPDYEDLNDRYEQEYDQEQTLSAPPPQKPPQIKKQKPQALPQKLPQKSPQTLPPKLPQKLPQKIKTPYGLEISKKKFGKAKPKPKTKRKSKKPKRVRVQF